MRVKKFEAKSMKEALQMVKQELGPDAVILAARDNRQSFGIAGQASVEVTAAVSESTLQKKRFVESRLTTPDREKFSQSDARTQRRIIEKMLDRRNEEQEAKAPRAITTTSYIDIADEAAEEAATEEKPNMRRIEAFAKARGRSVRELLSDFERDFDEAQLKAKERAGVKRPIERSPQVRPTASESRGGLATYDASPVAVQTMETPAPRSTPRSAPLPAPPAAQSAHVQGAVEQQRSTQEIDSLKGEIQRLQSMLEGFQRTSAKVPSMHPGAEFGLPYEASAMYQRLVESGISTENAGEILHAAVNEIEPMKLRHRAVVEAWVANHLLNAISTVANPLFGRVHLFVGGAGSGKTSTMVKMASQLVVRERKKVAILTTDTFKVGAVDQLKIYCQILNVPFAVIRSRQDWEWVLTQLQGIDHILVDHPGFQMHEMNEIQLMRSLLPPEGLQVATHLCVSTTSKDSDALEVARRYQVLAFTDLIFTNLDQSVHHGLIFNLHKKTARPLHSFGIGPRVPEDFEAATKERVLDLIFKLSKLRREWS